MSPDAAGSSWRVTAEGHAESERASHHLTQLCEHLAGKAANRSDLRVSVERDHDRAAVDFGWARCELRAGERRLTLRVEADDRESLDALRGFLTRHLAELGAQVRWRGEEGADDRRASMRGFHRRTRR